MGVARDDNGATAATAATATTAANIPSLSRFQNHKPLPQLPLLIESRIFKINIKNFMNGLLTRFVEFFVWLIH